MKIIMVISVCFVGLSNVHLLHAKDTFMDQVNNLKQEKFAELDEKHEQQRRNSSSSNSSLNYTPCNIGDRCFELIKHQKSGAAAIRCTKGPSTGKEKCLGYNKDTGKYASGCSMTDAFAHHYTLDKAGNNACEY